MNHHHLVVILMYILWMPTSQAQEPSYREYNTSHGLAQNQIVASLQDSRGYMWLGTKSGVSRFDGIKFRNFFKKDGLPDDYISTLTQSPEGEIYVLTRSGFAVFDGFNFTLYPYDKGSIFIGWGDSDLLTTHLMNGWTFTTTTYAEAILFKDGIYYSADSLFPGISAHSARHHWFSEDQQKLLFFCADAEALIMYDKTQKPPTQELVPETGRLVAGSHHQIAFQSNDSVYLFNKNTLDLEEVFGFDLDQNGSLVFMESRYKFYCRQLLNHIIVYNEAKTEQYRFNYPYITAITKDRENNLWLLGERGALKIISEQFVNYPAIPNGPLYPWSIVEDKDGGLWISDFGKGLFYFDGNDYRRVEVEGIPSSGQHDMYYMNSFIDSRDRIWKPHAYGVVVIEGNRAQLLPGLPHETVLAATENPGNGEIYLGQMNNFVIIDPDNNIISYPVLPGNKPGIILSMITDKNGNVWIGNDKGISLWEENQFIHLPDENISWNLGAISMTKDHKGNLWLGNSEGLFFYDYQDTIVQVGKETIEKYVVDLQVVDSTGLFVGMRDRMGYLDLEQFYSAGIAEIDIYDQSNGFQGLEVRQNGSSLARDGSLWICASDRFINFNPNHKQQFVSLPLTPLIKNILYLNDNMEWVPSETKSKRGRESWIFSHQQNNLRFEFAGITMEKPEKVMYRFKIQELDEDWSVPVSERHATYTYFPPGNYTFLVDMIKSNGEWSNSPASVHFVISYAWWNTAVFKVMLTILTITLIFFASYKISVYRRKAKLQRLNREKQIAELRLEAIKAQTDPHFIFNVLNSVGSSILNGNREESYDILVKFSKLIRRVFEKKSDPCASLKEEVQFLADYLDLQKQRFKDTFDYTIHVESEVDENTPLPRLFLQTLAENALKHGILPAKCKKKIQIDIRKFNGRVYIAVEDNGLGMNCPGRAKTSSTGRGLTIARQLFEIFNHYNKEKIHFIITDLQERKNKNTGTKVTVSIPDGYTFDIFTRQKNNYLSQQQPENDLS
ncbi:MAG: hypothetical protein EA361_09000 [Bacteroidetes bacterium]|nr:MAG: hypothetical protein EA361_09000 [Bacteroidota bacterium]